MAFQAIESICRLQNVCSVLADISAMHQHSAAIICTSCGDGQAANEASMMLLWCGHEVSSQRPSRLDDVELKYTSTMFDDVRRLEDEFSRTMQVQFLAVGQRLEHIHYKALSRRRLVC
jgi:hypothetical protein